MKNFNKFEIFLEKLQPESNIKKIEKFYEAITVKLDEFQNFKVL